MSKNSGQTFKSFDQVDLCSPAERVLGRVIDNLVHKRASRSQLQDALIKVSPKIGSDPAYAAAWWLVS